MGPLSRALAWLLLGLLTPAGACAGEGEELARRILDAGHLSIGRLESLKGTARFTYAGTGARARTHRMRFYFRKPFQLLIDETSGSFRFSVFDGRIALYFPKEHEVLSFDVGGTDSTAVRQFVDLVRLENFQSGFGLDEVQSHFAVTASEKADSYEALLTPHLRSAWRVSLALNRVVVTVSKKTQLPSRVEVWSRPLLSRPPQLTFSMEITDIETNVKIRDEAFSSIYPPSARRLGSMELVRLILEMTAGSGKASLDSFKDELKKGLQKVIERPWGR